LVDNRIRDPEHSREQCLCARVPNIDVVFDDVRVDFYIPVGHVRGSRIKMNLPQVELAGFPPRAKTSPVRLCSRLTSKAAFGEAMVL